ncbi:MAG: STAS domain-containing protein [Parcubacteria group bacterium]
MKSTSAEVRAGVVVVHIRPNSLMDRVAIPRAEELVTEFIDQGHTRFVLDMEDVEWLSSTGASSLLHLWHTVRNIPKPNPQLVLCKVGGKVRGILDTLNLTTILTTYDTADEAVRALTTPQPAATP